MTVEQAGNRVHIVLNGALLPADARAVADEINRLAGVIEAAVPDANARVIADDVRAAVAQLPETDGRTPRAVVLKAVADYLAQAGYTKPAIKP
jgi:hypothetical protein